MYNVDWENELKFRKLKNTLTPLPPQTWPIEIT
jgi:hypothetical protein